MSRRLTILLAALAATAGIGGLVGYNLSLKHDIDSQLYIPKRTRVTPEIALLQQYVRIDTSNPPGNETNGARFLAGVLVRNGVAAEVIESAPGRGSVYARIKGKRPGEGLLLLSHIDVVPAPPRGWTRPPFAGSIYLDALYGRGTLDMKGIGICQLAGFLDVARSGRTPERDIVFLAVADEEEGGHLGTEWLLSHRPDIFEGVRYAINEGGIGICQLAGFLDVARSGRTPERDIVFLAVADEEEGGHLGTEWLLAHRPDVFEGIQYAINEGGITETQQEKISYVGIEVGTKLTVDARLRAPDRATMQRVRIALEPFSSPHDPDRILPQVRLYFHDIAPFRREEGPRLADIDATIANGKFWLMNRPYHELTQNILWLEGVHEDDRGATMRVVLFNLPDENPDARLEWLRATISPLGAQIDQVLSKSGPAPFTPLDTPLYRLLSREARRQLGDVHVGPQILAVSDNDSRYLRARGIFAYGIWPFPVNFYQTLGIHGIDERVRLDWFKQGVSLTRGVVNGWAFEPQPGN